MLCPLVFSAARNGTALMRHRPQRGLGKQNFPWCVLVFQRKTLVQSTVLARPSGCSAPKGLRR
ncbi:MAG: hypothetical protein AAFR63_06535 [Cyanobacteria bacterium J06631_6]